jgi:peptidyl-tRNA hydrolase
MKLLEKIVQILLRRNPSNLADLCIVGLGNPGDKYSNTRHNLGYDFVEIIAQRFNTQFSESKKLDASIAEFNFGEKSILS